MLGFAESFLAWLVSTAVPAFLGMTLAISLGKRVDAKYVSAFALGIFLWVFIDVIGDSANLDVNAGLAGGWVQSIVVTLFVVGLVAFLSLDRSVFSGSVGPEDRLVIPALVALAVGIHGLGEGAAFAATAATTPIASLFEAFGGLGPGSAYVLHKFLESTMICACYLSYAGGQDRGGMKRLGDAALLTAVFVAPSIVAMATGYFISYNVSFFYALGAGTLVYAALRLARPLYASQNGSGGTDSVKIAISLVIGLVCIYAAALLHA